MSARWKRAAELLREAADTIDQRSALRDDDDGQDLIYVASELSRLPATTILTAFMAVKEARWRRAGDLDSAVDFLAYQARLFAEAVKIEPSQKYREAFAAAMSALSEHDEIDTLRAGGTD